MNDMTNTSQQYPFVEDATIVLGPGVFAAEDRSVLNWDGVNYVPQPAPQPPTREQIETLRNLACDGSGVCQSPLHVHGCYSDRDGTARDDRAGHPPAETCERCGGTGFQGDGPFSAGVPCPDCAAEPPRIEDMAPGAEFTADTWPGAMPVRWRIEPDGWYSRIVTGGRSYFADRVFDPSTIRDVTPPA